LKVAWLVDEKVDLRVVPLGWLVDLKAASLVSSMVGAMVVASVVGLDIVLVVLMVVDWVV